MSRGEEEAILQELREALEKARTDLRRYRQNDLTAPNAGQCLDALQGAVAEYLTAAQAALQRRFEEAATEPAPSLEGRGGQVSSSEGFEEAKQVELEKSKRRLTAAEATVPLPFSRPATYILEDKPRRLRLTITVEDLIA